VQVADGPGKQQLLHRNLIRTNLLFMESGYKKRKHRPRQRDNYIDKEMLQEEPATRKLVKNDGFQKHERVKDLRKQLNSSNELFSQLQLPPFEEFLQNSEKAECSSCKKSNRFYCLNCLKANDNRVFPKVKLPCQTVVLHHPQEKVTKSSGLPLAILSDDVTVMTYK
jgi:hypothetical protein